MDKIKNCLNLRKYFLIICANIVFLNTCFLFGCGNYSEVVDTGVKDSLEYYNSYLSDKIQQIKDIEKNNTISKSFYFITDLHWEYNTKKSPFLINKIQSETNVKNLIFGGDYIAKDYEDANEALTVMKTCIESFNTENYVAIIGNHELNNELTHENTMINDIECNNVINNGRFENSYFKTIDESERVCNIFLNTNTFTFNSTQYSWLKELLVSLDESWTVLIFMHIYNAYRPVGVCLERDNKGILLDNLLEENRNAIKCSVAGIFSGHTHRDYFNYNHFGCPVISTTCDSAGSYNHCDNLYTRASNTITEQAFDVVQIDLTKKTIFLTRIGAGVDRIYYFK